MRAFKTALERGTPDAVYLLHGDNDFLKDEKVRDLIARLSDPGTRDFNLDQVRGGDVDGALDGLVVIVIAARMQQLHGKNAAVRRGADRHHGIQDLIEIAGHVLRRGLQVGGKRPVF